MPPSRCSANIRLFARPQGGFSKTNAHVVLSDPNRLPLTTYIHNVETEPRSIPPPSEMKSGSTALNNIRSPFSFSWRPRESNFEGLDAIIRPRKCGLGATVHCTCETWNSVTEGLNQNLRRYEPQAGGGLGFAWLWLARNKPMQNLRGIAKS
jgi:hypothetical protein